MTYPINCSFTHEMMFIARVQWRFPRSKKKRIQRKWERNLENWRGEPDGKPRRKHAMRRLRTVEREIVSRILAPQLDVNKLASKLITKL